MGGCLYPESLVQHHTEFLKQNILGNTHSLSNTQVYIPLGIVKCCANSSIRSKLSLRYADEARRAILHHFKASSEYTVVFTSNASAALKLVGEAYPFTPDSCLVIGVDSHNSVRIFYLCATSPTEFNTRSMEFGPSPHEKELKPSIFLRRRRGVSRHLVQKYVSYYSAMTQSS